MTRSLLQEWQPVTADLGLIDAPLDDVVAAFTDWQRSIGSEPSISWPTSLSATFHALPPLSAIARRSAFVPTTTGWTAYFASGILGSDPFPAMSELARRLSVLAMRVCATQADVQYPATIWEVYGPPALGGVPPLGYLRSVACANDGGRWTFETSGNPFPFEQVARYALKIKRERFDRGLLCTYLAEWHLRPFDDDFFSVAESSPSAVVDKSRSLTHRGPEYTLEEVQRGVPWAPPSR